MSIHLIPVKPDKNKSPAKQMRKFLDKTEEFLKKKAGPELTDAEKTSVENWNEPPVFVFEYEETRDTMLVKAFPTGPFAKKWVYVSEGVAGHRITPKRAQWLAFQPKYDPHTKPGGKFGGPGTYSGSTQYRKSVNWPGIQARHIPEVLKKRIEDKIVSDFEKYTRV